MRLIQYLSAAIFLATCFFGTTNAIAKGQSICKLMAVKPTNQEGGERLEQRKYCKEPDGQWRVVANNEDEASNGGTSPDKTYSKASSRKNSSSSNAVFSNAGKKAPPASRCDFQQQKGLQARNITLARQPLPSSNMILADNCKVRFPIEAISKQIIKTGYTTQELFEMKEVIDAEWKGECVDGFASGKGGLALALSKNGTCSPIYWFRFSGNAVEGMFSGKVSVSHNMEQGWTEHTNEFYVLKEDSFSSQSEYAEAVDPKLRIAREANERKERERYERERQKEEDAYNAVYKAKDARPMFIGAVRYEDSGDQSKAKTIYRELLKRFPNSQEALKASDRLARLRDAEAAENSNRSARQGEADASCQQAQMTCRAQCAALSDKEPPGFWSESPRTTCISNCYGVCR